MASGPQLKTAPLIGLTGGIGAGKSIALSLFDELGAATLSTDAVVHALYARDDIRDEMIERWGPEIALEGVVDRGEIARRVFEEPDELEWLEQRVWPLVGNAVDAFAAEARTRDPRPRAIVIETPLLFEAGLASRYDVTVAVVASDETRAAWTADREHHSIADRERRQLPQEEKARRADHVIRNDSSIQALKQKLADLLDNLEEAS